MVLAKRSKLLTNQSSNNHQERLDHKNKLLHKSVLKYFLKSLAMKTSVTWKFCLTILRETNCFHHWPRNWLFPIQHRNVTSQILRLLMKFQVCLRQFFIIAAISVSTSTYTTLRLIIDEGRFVWPRSCAFLFDIVFASNTWKWKVHVQGVRLSYFF